MDSYPKQHFKAKNLLKKMVVFFMALQLKITQRILEDENDLNYLPISRQESYKRFGWQVKLSKV